MNAPTIKSLLALFTCATAVCLLAAGWDVAAEVVPVVPGVSPSSTGIEFTQRPHVLAQTQRTPTVPLAPGEARHGMQRVLLEDGSPASGLRIQSAGSSSSRSQVVDAAGTVPLEPQGVSASPPKPAEPSLSAAAFFPLVDQDLPTWTAALVSVEVVIRGRNGTPEPSARLLLGQMEQDRWLDPASVRALRADAQGIARFYAIPGDYLLEARSGSDVGHRSLYLNSLHSSRARAEVHLASPAGRAGLRLTVLGPGGEALDYQALLLISGGSRAVRILRSEDALEGQHWGLPEGDFELRLIARSCLPASYYRVTKNVFSVRLAVGELGSVQMEPQLQGRLSMDLSRFPAGTERLSASLRRLPEGDWVSIEELEFREGGYTVSIDLAPGAVRRVAQLLSPGEYEMRLDNNAQVRAAATIVAGRTTVIAP